MEIKLRRNFFIAKAIGLPDQFLSMPPEVADKPEENHIENEYNNVTSAPKTYGGGALQVSCAQII